MRMTIALVVVAAIGVQLLLGGCASLNAERNAPPIGSFIDIAGERLHYLDLGPRQSEKPPVVLIHGASVNLRDMHIALGDQLSATRRVIIVDRPGRGYSTRPEDGWRLESQADLIRGLASKLDATNAVVVGQSYGGAVALAYALKYQNEMAGLVLLAPVSHEWPGGVAWYNKVSGWPIAGDLLRLIVIPAYAPIAAKSGVVKSFEPDPAPADYYEKSGLTLLFRPRDFKNNAADLRHLKAEIVSMKGRYPEISIPTAIVVGADDRTVSPKIHSAALASEIAGADYVVLPDTGHALHHSETRKVVQAIDNVTDRSQARRMRRNAAE